MKFITTGNPETGLASGIAKVLDSDFCSRTNGWDFNDEETQNKFRKASASPTVYRGRVYFPVYEPDKGDACSLGRAYVCAQDDECGSNDSPSISDDVGVVPPGDCYQLRQRGILSKLVVFGGSLFGNVAGPSDTTDTLIKILAGDAMFKSYRRSWRENY